MAIQVGDEVQDWNGDLVTVLAIAGDEAAILHRDAGICARRIDCLMPYTPPAPEPPLTGEQMGYIAEWLGGVLQEAWDAASHSDNGPAAIRRIQDVVTVDAKEFRK